MEGTVYFNDEGKNLILINGPDTAILLFHLIQESLRGLCHYVYMQIRKV